MPISLSIFSLSLHLSPLHSLSLTSSLSLFLSLSSSLSVSLSLSHSLSLSLPPPSVSLQSSGRVKLFFSITLLCRDLFRLKLTVLTFYIFIQFNLPPLTLTTYHIYPIMYCYFLQYIFECTSCIENIYLLNRETSIT